MNYKQKYKKYKQKYLNFKNNQQGGLNSYKILVLGGGGETTLAESYCKKNQSHNDCGFYDIGYHENSYFGSDRDWNNIDFWDDLDTKLKTDKLIYDCIMIDKATESPLDMIHNPIIERMVEIISRYLNPDGIIITEDNRIRYSKSYKDLLNQMNDSFYNLGFNKLVCFRFKGDTTGSTFLILSKKKSIHETILIDKQGLYPIKDANKLFIPINSMGKYTGYTKPESGYEVTREKDRIEFCKNRIIGKTINIKC
jgi:hypothetical protein